MGEIVLVADANEPRNSWPRGIIQIVYPGADGIVRVVDVRTTSGVRKVPAHKICALELTASTPDGSVLNPVQNTERENVV